MSFKIFFKNRFAAFLRENFTSPEHVAICFGVTARCATYWWEGSTAPNGAAVAQAATDPQLGPSFHQHMKKDAA